jgi:hypothetical protein
MSPADIVAAPLRGSFHGRYLKTPLQRDKRSKLPRLLDCLLLVVQWGDLRYLAQPDPGEFVVVDLEQREKGFFELPRGATPDDLHGMIEGQFGARAERIGEFTWVV